MQDIILMDMNYRGGTGPAKTYGDAWLGTYGGGETAGRTIPAPQDIIVRMDAYGG